MTFRTAKYSMIILGCVIMVATRDASLDFRLGVVLVVLFVCLLRRRKPTAPPDDVSLEVKQYGKKEDTT